MKKGIFILEWSTEIDAPVTYAMTLEEFNEYYRKKYGDEGMKELPERLERVERTGSSGYNHTLDWLLEYNRAGEDQTPMSREDIIAYCLERPKRSNLRK